MTDTILYVTVVMAVLCTALSTVLSIYFWGHRGKPLGIAVCAMLAGEALGMLVVSVFATLELMQTLPHFHPLAASSIRWVAIVSIRQRKVAPPVQGSSGVVSGHSI